MSGQRNTSPYNQRRAQTYDIHAGSSSADPYDGVDTSAADSKQTMANRAQSMRHSSKSFQLGALSREEQSSSQHLGAL